MRILKVSPHAPDPDDIAQAVDVLARGGIVAYPTDTFYGLAVDPRRDAAVERLFAAKSRVAGQALPLIAASLEQAKLAATFGDVEHRLAAQFWPGPLTLVLPARKGLSPQVTGTDLTIAVRVPAHDVARALASRFGFGITATSANRSGSPPAATGTEAADALDDAIDLVLDGGPAAGGLPSTIVESTRTGLRLVRAGAVAWERVLESLK
jgi:L-threonylcarbamoyladenylate synthase